jgi:hypothetical protein
MKKNRVLIIATIILVGLSAYFYFNNSNSTFNRELTDFAVEDTASISRIFLVDKEGRKILLDRNKETESWTLNNQYEAKLDGVNMLLRTIKRVEVKSPVPIAMEENVIKRLSSTAIKVEIYQNYKHKKPSKVYYVGGGTKDGYGTFMLLENSSKPFITYIKNNRGTLTPRYFMNEIDWRSTKIMELNSSEISSIKVEQIEHPENSFIIENIVSEKKQFVLRSLLNGMPVYKNIDTLQVMDYISRFSKLHFEFYPPVPEPALKDSLKNNEYIFNLEVKSKNGVVHTVKGYRSQPFDPDKINNETGEPFEADPDRLYAKIDGLEDWVIIQYFVFDPIIMSIGDFEKR